MILRALTHHPSSVGESYFKHLSVAFELGRRLVHLGLICMIHGILPFLFKDTGTKGLKKLNLWLEDIQKKRQEKR